MSASSRPWIRQVRRAVAAEKQRPAWGAIPAFPWQELSQGLGALWGVPHCAITSMLVQELPMEELVSALGDKPLVVPLTVHPLTAQVYWAIGTADLARMIRVIASPKHPIAEDVPLEFARGIWAAMKVQTLEMLEKLPIFAGLSFAERAEEPLVREAAHCIDVTLHVGDAHCLGRIICPMSACDAFALHWKSFSPVLDGCHVGLDALLDVQVRMGFVHVTADAWKCVVAGDFLVLDQGCENPETGAYRTWLSIQGVCLFHAWNGGGKLQITDRANYMEGAAQMNAQTQQQAGEGTTDLVRMEQVPVSVAIEVGRIAMTLEKLLQMQPGSVLEMPQAHGQLVDLLINGALVGRGELIKIGDMLGVRIIKVAHS